MVTSVNRYRGSDIPANGLSGSFFVKEEYANSLLRQLESVDTMTLMLEEREWAEHAGKGPVAERLESAITEMHNELDAQRLRADTAEADLLKFDEGMRALACSLGAGGYNAEILTADQLVGKVQWGIDNLLEVNERMLAAAEQRLEQFTGLIEEFCQRVEAGEVRSKATYAKFKAALNPNPEAESHE